MEKKKLKLSITGSSQKTFSSIEQAKSKSKNTVVIEKKSSKFQGKPQFARPNNDNFRANLNFLDQIIIVLRQIEIFPQSQIILADLHQLLLQILKKEN